MLPPLQIEMGQTPDLSPHADVDVHIAFDGTEEMFLAAYKPEWNRRTFESAVAAATRLVGSPSASNAHPLVILPYLSDEHLAELVHQRVSGLDLCGNGVVLVPGRWFVQRSGCPNRFRIEQELRNPYKGLASLVARTLLRKPLFHKLEDLHTEILQRGGHLSLALVSRAIKRLEEAVLVQSAPGIRVRLAQPARLLESLVAGAETDRLHRKWRGRILRPPTEFLPQLFSNATAHRVHAVMTGIGSAAHYTALSMEDVAYVYSNDIETLLEGLPFKPGERFANLEIRIPYDETVYFDTERDACGIVWASPVQTYLEMMHCTDARLHEGAETLRTSLLRAIAQQTDGGTQ